jgi:ferredoxin-NADP reductase
MAIHGANSATRMTDISAPDLAYRRPARWQPAKITAIARLTPRVMSFRFLPSQPFVYRAGQHVDVRLTAADGYTAQRSYSIASAPEAGDEIELVIEKLENGEVSPFFHEVVAIGDEIEIKGPLGGHFIWSAEQPGPLVLIGGGSGVVPLMSMIRHRHASGSQASLALLYSSREWNEVIFRAELLALDDRRDGFDLTLTLTREPPKRDKDFGRRIDQAMIESTVSTLPGRPALAYVCGANAFVSAASDALIAAGVATERIRTERYGV